MRKSASKELTFIDFDKCVHDITHKLMKKGQMCFGSYNHKIYIVTSNKIGMRNPYEENKKLQDNDTITTYSHGTNIPFIKYFADKDILNSIEEIKKIYKEFTKND